MNESDHASSDELSPVKVTHAEKLSSPKHDIVSNPYASIAHMLSNTADTTLTFRDLMARIDREELEVLSEESDGEADAAVRPLIQVEQSPLEPKLTTSTPIINSHHTESPIPNETSLFIPRETLTPQSASRGLQFQYRVRFCLMVLLGGVFLLGLGKFIGVVAFSHRLQRYNGELSCPYPSGSVFHKMFQLPGDSRMIASKVKRIQQHDFAGAIFEKLMTC